MSAMGDRQMMDLLDDIYGTLFSPVSTFKRMIEERTSIAFAVIVVLVGSVCSGAGSVLIQSTLISSIGTYPGFEAYQLQSMISPTASLVLGVVGGVLGWVIIAGVLHLVAKALGGRGTFEGMLLLMGFATLPNIFQAPAGLIAFFSGGLSGLMIFFGLMALLGLWILALNVIAIREAQGFTTGKAIVTLILPIVILVILALVLTAILLMAVM
ncbi:MAG: Yip1 family protein [Archaeoglobaceae archaeon]